MDACEKKWFSGIVTYLHLVVDKETKKVLFRWIEYDELRRAYFILLFNLILIIVFQKERKLIIEIPFQIKTIVQK